MQQLGGKKGVQFMWLLGVVTFLLAAHGADAQAKDASPVTQPDYTLYNTK